jgi:hypothetical protein
VNFDYRWGKRAEDEAILSVLAERRANLLRQSNAYPGDFPEGLAGGCLLIADPHNSDTSGLSMPETGGFIDIWDVPAWDTWVDCMEGQYGTILLCWIPPSFISLTEDGIAVNPMECFFWAPEYRARGYDIPFLQELKDAGLLLRPYEQLGRHTDDR